MRHGLEHGSCFGLAVVGFLGAALWTIFREQRRAERDAARREFLSPDAGGRYAFDALVTSYEAVLKERSALGRIPWRYLIIDEAHRIKNEKSSLSRAVRLLSADFRLLITGTPLQNNLQELWALLNFLLHEIFGDSDQFDEWFSMSGKEGQENVIRKLHTVLRWRLVRLKTVTYRG
jgi:SWI/SNF-related matrix-associated actin-dependent regulator of chromatin subfamily A member 5